MALSSRRLGKSISDTARARISSLKAYPTLDTWMNPITRGLARRLANQEWLKTLNEIDFPYRMSEASFGGQSCIRYETETTKRDDAVIFYAHGGALLSGSPRVNAAMILPTCQLSGVEAFGVSYSLVPEGRFPEPLNEIDAAYKAFRQEHAGKKIIVFGDSIGGGLLLSNMMRWRDEGTPLPDASILVSPALDGAGDSDTHLSVGARDPLFRSNSERNCKRLFNFYAPGADLKDPLISPIYGDMAGLPPMLVHVGTREVLLGDAARLSEKARRAGVDTTLRVFDGMFHLFHMHWALGEAKAAHEDIAAFINGV